MPFSSSRTPIVETASISVLGVQVHPLGPGALLQVIQKVVTAGGRAVIAHVNVHGLNLAFRHSWLHQFFNRADVVFCDGAGVMLGAHILGSRIPQRITYADWMWSLAEFVEEQDFTLYFLGAKPGVADKSASKLASRFPHLRIVGTHHGYFDKTSGGSENESVIHQINSVKPNLLLVAFGMPDQELWLMQNWHRIQANVVLTGGAVFDYISGDLRRGPRWMTDHGLEWLARMYYEPRRLWKRYLFGNPLFIWRVVTQRLGISRPG